MMGSILVVFTAKHHGYAPLKHAINIAKGINASSLRLLYVVPSTEVSVPGPLPPGGAFWPVPLRDSHVYKELIDITSLRLSDFEEICNKEGIKCKKDTKIGKRGYLIARMATLCHLVIFEKRPKKRPINGIYREISLAAISRSSGVPLLAVPQEYEDVKTIQSLYDGSLKSSLLLGFSIHLAKTLGITLRVLLINGPECRAEDMERGAKTMLTDLLPDSESSVLVIRKAKRTLEQFGNQKDVITTISPGWYTNYMHFRLSRNETVQTFKGPVAIVP